MHPDSAKSEIAAGSMSHLEIFMLKPCSEDGSLTRQWQTLQS